MPCLFCKIVGKKLPSESVYEDDNFFAFRDIHPIAPIHILLIPKKHIETIEHLESHDSDLIGDLLLTAKKVAEIEGISESGYRLIFNVGKNAGQTVGHLHLHLLGGKELAWE